MIVLALETTSFSGGVALMDGPCPLAVVELNARINQSRKLLSAIDFALNRSGMTLDDVQAVAVSRGPGSFTGVRIGLAHAKTLAWARGLPLVGIGALDGLAARQHSAGETIVCALIAARAGEVFAGAYRVKEAQNLIGLEPLMTPVCAPAADALAGITRLDAVRYARQVICCGNGAERHESDVLKFLSDKAHLAPPWRRHPSPLTIGLLALPRLEHGDREEPATLEPMYIRPEHAEFRPAPPPIPFS